MKRVPVLPAKVLPMAVTSTLYTSEAAKYKETVALPELLPAVTETEAEVPAVVLDNRRVVLEPVGASCRYTLRLTTVRMSGKAKLLTSTLFMVNCPSKGIGITPALVLAVVMGDVCFTVIRILSRAELKRYAAQQWK